MDHMRISGSEPSSVILSQRKWCKMLKIYAQKCQKQGKAKRDGEKTHKITIMIRCLHCGANYRKSLTS